jgi:hypothetical protein
MPPTPGFLDHFASGIGPHWHLGVIGRGRLESAPGSLRLVNVEKSARAYSNAQIDDYQGLPRRSFLWRPPLTLRVRARFSHPGLPLAEDGDILRGTAGFGFWNDPFLMSGLRWPALPRALWFFYASPPSDMQLALQVPGYGWKAASIDALRWPSLFLAPAAPVLVPLMNIRSLYRRLWPPVQRALRIAEAPVAVMMTEWHTYVLDWGVSGAQFSVDGVPLLAVPHAPRGPLGLVIWLDNQYLVCTPWGRLAYGRLSAPGRQWLELDSVEISRRSEL